VCFGQSICHGQGRKQNIWSVDLPLARKETKYMVSWSALGKEGNKICGQLICPGQGRKQNMWSVDLTQAQGHFTALRPKKKKKKSRCF
jgi:hypothetical protein